MVLRTLKGDTNMTHKKRFELYQNTKQHMIFRLLQRRDFNCFKLGANGWAWDAFD
jgi:hypothetical protein